MRALVFDGSAVKYRQFHAEPTCPPEEALIQVQMAGICQTDLEIARGYMGFKGILGHEFVGTVVKCKEARWVGRRVVGEINCVCGKCDMCQRGLSSHCRDRSVLGILNRDGAFADFVCLPVRNLHAVPENVSNEEAVFAEPLAAAVQVLRQVPIDGRTKVTVLGDGRLGQLVAQVIRRTGCPLTLVGHHAAKLGIAERLGIHTVLDAQLTPRKDQDVVVDCTGKAAGVARAFELLRPRGTLVLKTTVAAGVPLNLAPVVIDELTILGSRCGPMGEALALLGRREVDVACLISRRMKLDSGEAALVQATGTDVLKILLTFDR